MLRELGPADAFRLERFLRGRPVDHCLALGLFTRYGFNGPVSYYGLYPPGSGTSSAATPTAAPATDRPQAPDPDLRGLITLDRGRALILGDAVDQAGRVTNLLGDAQLRTVFAPTSTMEPLLHLQAGAGAEAWLHARQEVEQQVVLSPMLPARPATVPAGVAIRVVAPDELSALAPALKGKGRWSNESVASLGHRLRYGFVAAAFRGSDLEGILFANLSAPEYPRVSRLWASSERRGGDIAAALVYAACTELAGRGAVAASAWVAQRDVAARRILTRVGWHPWLLWKKVLLRQ